MTEPDRERYQQVKDSLLTAQVGIKLLADSHHSPTLQEMVRELTSLRHRLIQMVGEEQTE